MGFDCLGCCHFTRRRICPMGEGMTLESDHIRVLKAAGFKFDENNEVNRDPQGFVTSRHRMPDLTQDDLAAKYLLPVTMKYIDSIWPNAKGWAVMYNGTDVIVGDEDIVGGETFGQALHAFTIALLDAGVIE